MIITFNEKNAIKLIEAKARNLNIEFEKSSKLSKLLESIPIQTKQDLIKYGIDNREKFIREGILFSETSGSTGLPLLTPRNQIDLDWNTNNQMMIYKKHLQSGCDRVAIVHPGILSPFVEASTSALKKLGIGFVRVYPIPKVCDYRRILDIFQQNEITTIMTTPSLAYKLLYEIQKINKGFENFPIKKILLTGENVSPQNLANMIRIVGEGTKALPFVYGSSEVATVMYGLENCAYKSIDEDFVFELVDPKTGQHVRKKESGLEHTGNLVITWLRDGLLPILRYNTGDIFRINLSSGDAVWHSLGRFDNRKPKFFDELIIDRIIYNAEIPIYHFSCEVENEDVVVNIFSSCDSTSRKLEKKLEKNLEKNLPYNFSFHVNINPSSHDFYDFSPKPKMSKFKYIN